MMERLSDYLLGELDPAEREAFEAGLARDPALDAEAERLATVVTRLEALDRDAWDPPEAPPLALPRPATPPRRRRVLALRPLVAAALACVLLAAGLGAGLLLSGGQGEPGPSGGRVVALDPVKPLGGSAHGTAKLVSGDRATLELRDLKPSSGGDFYELWLLNSADDLVSLGSFRVPASGNVHVTVPLPADPGRFAALDVSVEPPDGNPAHSSRSVLRAPLS